MGFTPVVRPQGSRWQATVSGRLYLRPSVRGMTAELCMSQTVLDKLLSDSIWRHDTPLTLAIGDGKDAGWLRLAIDTRGDWRLKRYDRQRQALRVRLGLLPFLADEPGGHRLERDCFKAEGEGVLLVKLPAAALAATAARAA